VYPNSSQDLDFQSSGTYDISFTTIVNSPNAEFMIPDFNLSSFSSQIKPSIKKDAVGKLKNYGDRLKSSDTVCKKLLRKNGC
jgi:hypothetical protein